MKIIMTEYYTLNGQSINSGEIKEYGNYVNGEKYGEWKEYNLEGEITKQKTYKNGYYY